MRAADPGAAVDPACGAVQVIGVAAEMRAQEIDRPVAQVGLLAPHRAEEPADVGALGLVALRFAVEHTRHARRQRLFDEVAHAGFAAGAWHPFVIEDQQGRIIGRANLKDIDRAGFRAEVGYRIAEDACGQGLATTALEHLIRVAQSQWKLRQLVASVYASNLGSAKVLERCGFTRAALDRKDDSLHDYRFDLVTQRIE